MLEQDGWLFWPDDPNRIYRLWFLRPTPEARSHHLQIMQHDHAAAQAALFRDALRKDPALREAFAAKAGLRQQPRNALATDAHSPGQFGMGARRTVGAARGRMCRTDFSEQRRSVSVRCDGRRFIHAY